MLTHLHHVYYPEVLALLSDTKPMLLEIKYMNAYAITSTFHLGFEESIPPIPISEAPVSRICLEVSKFDLNCVKMTHFKQTF